MKSIKDVLENKTETTPKVDYTNDWLDFDEVVETKDCKLCNGSGLIIVDEINDKRGVALRDELAYKNDKDEIVYKSVLKQECDCVLRKRALTMFTNRIQKSGLSNQLKTKTFKTYKVTEKWQQDIVDMCIRFVKQPKTLLALIGQTGAGKTHLGTAIVGNLVHKGYSASYVEWMKEMNIAKDDYYKVKADKLEEWKNVDVLYIDDLFKNKKNDISLISNNEFDFAWDLLDSRLKREKITIISSEFSMTDFISLDEGAAGRLNEMAGDYLIDIKKDTSKNYRLKNIL